MRRRWSGCCLLAVGLAIATGCEDDGGDTSAHADASADRPAPTPDAAADLPADAPMDVAEADRAADSAADASPPSPDGPVDAPAPTADGAPTDGPPAAGDPDAAASDAPPATPEIGRPVGCRGSGTVWSGSEALIEAFPTKDGVIVVRADRIALLGRDGQEKKGIAAPRAITTAAFDGAMLAVADGAIVTAYDASLEVQGMVTLVEPCATSVMVSGQRFVCGPSNDWDRVFYTYDMVQQAVVGQSSKFTYNGIPMRRIPMMDHFITVSTDSIPSDYHVYRVDPLGPVKFLGESPYHGDFPIDMTFAFVGRPPTHLVSPQGLLLKIFNSNCEPTSSTFGGSGCLVKDGALGTLWTDERFLALANDEARDLVYAVVGTSGRDRYSPGSTCAVWGCKVQRIDPVQRLVVGQRWSPLPLGKVIATHYDQECQMLLLGYASTAAPGGYSVDLLEHGGD